jgi:hypothetical protein
MNKELRRKMAVESVDGLISDIESSVKRGAAVFGAGELLTSLIPSFLGFDAGVDFAPKNGEAYTGERRDLKALLGCKSWLSTFYHIHVLIEQGDSQKIKAGDFIRLPVKVGAARYGGLDFKELDIEEAEAVVVAVFEREVVFQFNEVLFFSAINKQNTNEGGFKNSTLAVYLNERFIEVLALIKHILNRNLDGLRITLPTRYEVFGNEDDEEWGRDMNWGDPCRYEYYRTVKNRIRVKDDDTKWWWLSTPIAAYSTTFAVVNNNGFAYGGRASNVGGVAPAFCVT